MFRLNKKAQTTAEYAILIALVIAAAVAMQTYVKRGLSGGVKFAVDKMQKPGDAYNTGQYEPYYLRSGYTTTVGQYVDTEETLAGGEVERTFGAKTTERPGFQITTSTENAD